MAEQPKNPVLARPAEKPQTKRPSREQLKQLLLKVLDGLVREFRARPVSGSASTAPSNLDTATSTAVKVPSAANTERGEDAATHQLQTFSSLDEAGCYFESSFAQGDRSRRPFIVGGELWEVVNCGIPMLRPVRAERSPVLDAHLKRTDPELAAYLEEIRRRESEPGENSAH